MMRLSKQAETIFLAALLIGAGWLMVAVFIAAGTPQ